jgi:hypothetical protein
LCNVVQFSYVTDTAVAHFSDFRTENPPQYL